ncbi:MAG: DUF2730 family protein [Roseibium sp.]
MLDWIKGLEASFSLVAFLFGAAAFTTSWLTRGSKANAARINDLEAVNAELAGRVSSLETVIENQPTRDDFHTLNLKLSEMDGGIASLSTELKAVSRIATRIDDFLLNKRGE